MDEQVAKARRNAYEPANVVVLFDGDEVSEFALGYGDSLSKKVHEMGWKARSVRVVPGRTGLGAERDTIYVNLEALPVSRRSRRKPSRSEIVKQMLDDAD